MLNKKRHSPKKNNSQYSSFLSKLFDILNDETYKNIMEWSKDGNKIIITDVNKLSEIILPKFYKHRNFSSFVRQLNKYDFHKIKDKSIKGIIFEKKQFHKNCTKEEVIKISRSKKNLKENFAYNENMMNFFKKYETSINEQNNMKNEIEDIKKDNYELLKQIQICNTKIDKQSKNFKKVRTLSIVLMCLYMKNNSEKNEKSNKLCMLDFIKKYIAFKEIKINDIKKNDYPIEKMDSFNIGGNNVNILNVNNEGMSDDLSIFNFKNDSFYNNCNDLNLSKNNSSISIFKSYLY